mmetsp:Transcript_29634/g.53079  ORF Transcript_29634/g.53079 Transcript_29634/m.53079 type:complete len:114 (+) Transcript_29634:324-665(+)
MTAGTLSKSSSMQLTGGFCSTRQQLRCLLQSLAAEASSPPKKRCVEASTVLLRQQFLHQVSCSQEQAALLPLRSSPSLLPVAQNSDPRALPRILGRKDLHNADMAQLACGGRS